MNLGSIIFTKSKIDLKNLKVLCLLVLALLWGKMTADEALVDVVRMSASTQLSWTISDTAGHTLASSEDDVLSDSVTLILEANERFRINLSIAELAPQDTDILLVQVNGAPIMLIKAKLGDGEFSYPFFTGTQAPFLRVIGGSDADIADFPWQVYFSAGNYQCGGSIISKRWVLTAAHCTLDGEGEPIIAGRMKVKVGTSTPFRDSGKWYYVKSYTIHESYNKTSYENDIAVLELYNEIDFENAQIIELIDEDDLDSGATDPGVQAVVSGWGLTSVDPEKSPNILQEAVLPIVSNATASEIWGSLPQTMLMAGYVDGTKDACSGDSGGPLVVDVNGKKKLAGVVSWGSGECNTYGAFTRVSSYLEWIDENTKLTLNVPAGDLKICNTTDSSTYLTDVLVTDSFQWQLLPSNAGTLSFSKEKATVVWNSNFFGNVELRVRALVDDEFTAWAKQYIEVGYPTVLENSPDNLDVCEGDISSFRVEADGFNLTYNWYKNDAFFNSSSSPSLAYNSSRVDDSGEYYCIVSGICGDDTTDIFNLTVYPNTEIVSLSEDLKAQHGETLSLFVLAEGAEKQYQWYKDKEPVEGATDSILIIKEVDANDIGLYHVVVDGICLNRTSEEIYVYVGDKDSDKGKARIWPSYVTSQLQVAMSNKQSYSVEVYNLNAHLIYKEEGLTSQTLIDASSWANGSYIIKVRSTGFSDSFRFLKE